ncbi:cellulose binding domain-containing protein, partial [Micromonospora sp. NPDC002411]
MKRSRSLVLSLVTALAATLGAAWVALPAYAAGATASFVKTADWGSGWEGKYTITNGGTSTINGWSLAFDLPSGTTLGSYWDALLTSAGQRHTFTNRSWNGAIAPGASVSFGFLASGSGSPSGCQLNGASCGGGTPPTTPPPTTPPPTTPPPTTPPPTNPPTGDLPKHLLTGYWHNFDNPAVELRLRDVPTEYDLVAVAFAEATSTPGALTFGIDPGLAASLGGYTDADFTNDVRTLHSRGKRVILSVGGETGRVTVNDAASATVFADTAA